MLKEEGYQFMGAAFEVYNQLGYGMAEEVYQQSLEIELELRRIHFLTKHELDVFYKGRKLQTNYKPDLIVFNAIVVELKAVSGLLSEHEAQLFNYMRNCAPARRLPRQLRQKRGIGMETIDTDRFPSPARRDGTPFGANRH